MSEPFSPPPLRFSAKSMFSLVLVSGLGIGWWQDRRQLSVQVESANKEVDRLQGEVKKEQYRRLFFRNLSQQEIRALRAELEAAGDGAPSLLRTGTIPPREPLPLDRLELKPTEVKGTSP